ncbi:hypothetical protein FKM82_002632 [Ascaphus truei]
MSEASPSGHLSHRLAWEAGFDYITFFFFFKWKFSTHKLFFLRTPRALMPPVCSPFARRLSLHSSPRCFSSVSGEYIFPNALPF